MNLNAHGAACRCLLRLREKQGRSGISDAAFIARFLARYPDWRERPGVADPRRIMEIARDLKIADRGERCAEYDRVLAEHRGGHAVILQTERAPE